MNVKKIVVIGDVGGQYNSLVTCLKNLGVDTHLGTIPDTLKICQVGDIIHKGPSSDACVLLIDKLLRNNPGRWVQLLGNHDAQLLPGGTQFWNEPSSDETVEVIQRWWQEKLINIAAVFNTEGVTIRAVGGAKVSVGDGELLVTHAGLTAGAWQLLRCPQTASQTAETLNVRARESMSSVAWREGGIITGLADPAAGPLWAVPFELYSSWLNTAISDVPKFSQAHGHANPYSFRNNRWYSDVARLRKHLDTHVDVNKRITRVKLKNANMVFWAVDPGHGKQPAQVWEPLILEEK